MENNEKRDFYVYKHIRLDNNTCFYVGKGTGDRAYLPKRNEFYNNVRKSCGCKVVIIKNNLTEKEAFNLEKEVIEDYVFVFGYGINIDGYKDFSNKTYLTNCTWGGEGISGLNPYANKTPEEIKIINNKISNSMKGKMAGEKHPFYGKHHSDETNKKISESMKGKKQSEEAKQKISEKLSKKVICITTGETFNSIKDAEKHYKCKHISACCKGRRKSAGELNDVRLQWKYLEDYDDNCLEEYKLNISDQRSKKVICITTGKTFDCIKDAEKHYSCGGISKCCRGKRKHAGKLNGVQLQWKYLEDYDDNCLDEYKQKMSEARVGKQMSEEAKQKISKKVICITTGEEFNSIKYASYHYGIETYIISACCKGKRKSAGELNHVPLQWKFSEN